LRPVLAAHGQQISDSALLELYGELEAQAEAGEYAIRTAGLAAESLVYNESFDDLMRNPAVLRSVKTDMDNAKLDLKKGASFRQTNRSLFVITGGWDSTTHRRS
jgi:hypothetical protein